MENASKALLMSAGVLIGILLLTLMVSLFISSKDVAGEYEKTKQSESVQQFNANFTKYLGKELTIHDVVTIYNFATYNDIRKVNVNSTGVTADTVNHIKNDVENYTLASIKKYKLTIESYDEGYVEKIKFTEI